MQTSRIAIVGAGAGGLAAAMKLAARGLDVTVYERSVRAGGKIRGPARENLALDAGPTVFTMPWVFERLFDDAGARFDAALELRPLDRLAHHRWPDGSTLDLYPDLDASADAIGRFADATAAREYRAFAARAAKTYALLRDSFLARPQRGLLGLVAAVGPLNLAALLAIDPFRSLWQSLQRQFTDPRLRMLFARYATYCGSSPLRSPATLALISHAEREGVYRVRGGMRALARAMRDCAVAAGARIETSREVRLVTTEAGRASGVRLADGEHRRADAVIVNADTSAIATGLFGRRLAGAVQPTPSARRSLSAVTFAGRAPADTGALAYHSVCFGGDYAREFGEIFDASALPSTPTVYLCAPDRSGEARRLFALINAPANGDRADYDDATIAAARSRAEASLRRCGIALDLGGFEVTTPRDFDARYPATGGALYGPAMHGWRAAFRRPGSRTRIPGVYVAGGSVHPGSGVPMAALSGGLAADAVCEDLLPRGARRGVGPPSKAQRARP